MSSRELEVLRLVTAKRSKREICDGLVVQVGAGEVAADPRLRPAPKVLECPGSREEVPWADRSPEKPSDPPGGLGECESPS